jgi:hypothetical protein
MWFTLCFSLRSGFSLGSGLFKVQPRVRLDQKLVPQVWQYYALKHLCCAHMISAASMWNCLAPTVAPSRQAPSPTYVVECANSLGYATTRKMTWATYLGQTDRTLCKHVLWHLLRQGHLPADVLPPALPLAVGGPVVAGQGLRAPAALDWPEGAVVVVVVVVRHAWTVVAIFCNLMYMSSRLREPCPRQLQ